MVYPGKVQASLATDWQQAPDKDPEALFAFTTGAYWSPSCWFISLNTRQMVLELQYGSLFTRHNASCAKLSQRCAVVNRKRTTGRQGICQESLRKEVTVQGFCEWASEKRCLFFLKKRVRLQPTNQVFLFRGFLQPRVRCSDWSNWTLKKGYHLEYHCNALFLRVKFISTYWALIHIEMSPLFFSKPNLWKA